MSWDLLSNSTQVVNCSVSEIPKQIYIIDTVAQFLRLVATKNRPQGSSAVQKRLNRRPCTKNKLIKKPESCYIMLGFG